jgi:hypothetical protein
MCIDYQRRAESVSDERVAPPICKCGHARDDHKIEPPYYCNGCDAGEFFQCECDGYTISSKGGNRVSDERVEKLCDDCFCDGCAGPGKCRCIHAGCSHAERSEVVSECLDGVPLNLCNNSVASNSVGESVDGGARELEQEIEEIVKKYEPDFPFVKLEGVRTRCRAEARICMRAALRLAMERKAGR